MKPHKCKPIDYCICNPIATDPNENCPIHGSGTFPPRCGTCGRFLKYKIKFRNKDLKNVIIIPESKLWKNIKKKHSS